MSNETAYRHGIDPCGNDIPKTLEETVRWLEDRVAKVEAERDLAIAHDRQPYPTAFAYEQACVALEKQRARLTSLVAEIRRIYKDEWSDEHEVRVLEACDAALK